jgi:hypothetical protein
MNSLLSFQVILFLFVLLLLFLLCATGRLESSMLSVMVELIFCTEIFIYLIFSLKSLPDSGLRGEFLYSACVSVSRMGFFFWG